uniref:Peripheral subunit-binding (PSBD) domain-containing protein n=1 Tax=Anolis carolinensis TaxID=28377 RepID=A0A803T5T2_ANOCA
MSLLLLTNKNVIPKEQHSVEGNTIEVLPNTGINKPVPQLDNWLPLTSVGIKEESPLKGQKPTAGSQSFPTCTPENIVRQLKNEGVTVDRAVSTDGDILAKVMAQEGSESMSLGTPTGLLVEEGQEWKRVEIPSVIGEAASFSGPLATTPVPTPLSSVASLHKAEQHPEKLQFRSSPAASDILESHGLDVSSCTPSDPRGIFSKEDALSLLEQIQKGKPLEGKPVVSSLPSQQIEVPLMPSPDGKPVSAEHSPAPPVSVPGLPPSTGTFTEVPTSNIGRVIAKRLTESKTSVSHAYATAECDLGAVLKLRQELAKERMVSDSGSKMQGVSLKDVPAGLAPGTTCKPYTSRAAIAAVKHHRVKLEQEAHVDFAMAKSKVAPVQTPPRLELHATLLTAQLLVPAMLQPANSPLQKDIVVPVPEGDYISQRKRVRGLA